MVLALHFSDGEALVLPVWAMRSHWRLEKEQSDHPVCILERGFCQRQFGNTSHSAVIMVGY